MTPIQAILLGVIQGLTEFLPISSTAHLRLVPALLGWDDPGAAFTAVIQWGTFFATVAYFRHDLARLPFQLRPPRRALRAPLRRPARPHRGLRGRGDRLHRRRCGPGGCLRGPGGVLPLR